MTFLAPAFFAAALAVAAGAVAIHFIVMRQPPGQLLPTVRFVPMRDARAPTVARRPEDLLLLLLRVLLVLLVGAAFARPALTPRRVAVYHIVAIDRSRAVADAHEATDSAKSVLGRGEGSLILFDSAARPTDVGTMDSAAAAGPTAPSGSISSALLAALQTASRVRDRSDSLDLAIVSPFAATEFDAATDSLRALWPGAVRVIRVAPRSEATPVPARIQWPADGHAPGTIARERRDTVGAVVAGEVAVVAPFERAWRLTPASLARSRVVARWVDGEPAAIERGLAGEGCERDVAVAVPTAGDIALRPAYQRFAEAMGAPCGRADIRMVGGTTGTARSASDGEGPVQRELAALHGRGPALVAARALPSLESIPTPLVLWLLGAALVTVLAEAVVRRKARDA
ncbi:MAG TPA: BatA domain-containing protein [Gemmatimonadaceae bacterium]|nr:BatA domain-containing protein [Gemmatimonadaceae bacterium]